MKKKRFSPEQIAAILKEFENGKSAQEIVRDHGVSKAAVIVGHWNNISVYTLGLML